MLKGKKVIGSSGGEQNSKFRGFMMVPFEIRFAFFAIHFLFLFLRLALTSPCVMHYHSHFTDGQTKLREVMWLPTTRPSLCFICSCDLDDFPNSPGVSVCLCPSQALCPSSPLLVNCPAFSVCVKFTQILLPLRSLPWCSHVTNHPTLSASSEPSQKEFSPWNHLTPHWALSTLGVETVSFSPLKLHSLVASLANSSWALCVSWTEANMKLVLVAQAAVTKYPRLSGITTESNFLTVWRLESQDQGIGRVGFF